MHIYLKLCISQLSVLGINSFFEGFGLPEAHQRTAARHPWVQMHRFLQPRPFCKGQLQFDVPRKGPIALAQGVSCKWTFLKGTNQNFLCKNFFCTASSILPSAGLLASVVSICWNLFQVFFQSGFRDEEIHGQSIEKVLAKKNDQIRRWKENAGSKRKQKKSTALPGQKSKAAKSKPWKGESELSFQ